MQNNDRRTHKCECRWMDGNQWQWDLFLAFSLVVLVNPVTKLAATHTVANKGNPLHVFRPFIKSAFFLAMPSFCDTRRTQKCFALDEGFHLICLFCHFSGFAVATAFSIVLLTTFGSDFHPLACPLHILGNGK